MVERRNVFISHGYSAAEAAGLRGAGIALGFAHATPCPDAEVASLLLQYASS